MARRAVLAALVAAPLLAGVGGPPASAAEPSTVSGTVFHDLNGEKVSGVYEMVLHEMEKPLLEIVMKHAKSNQCKAADILGINRNTLRKKLKQYKLL